MAQETNTVVELQDVPQNDNPLLDAALSYAARGWSVLPLHSVTPEGKCTCGNSNCSSAGKHPRTVNGLKDATTDETTIMEWWTRWPDANVGVATGPSSGIIAIDIDPRHEGDESLADLEGKNGKLPDTVEAVTGGGGFHKLYNHPGYKIPCSAGKLGRGLDVRGDDGYIVVAPSIHVSGEEYEWEISSNPNDIETSDAPEWLLKLIATKKVSTLAVVPSSTGVCDGERNSHLTSLAGTMNRRGMGVNSILAALSAENQEKCKPPLSEDEVAKIAHGILRYDPAAPQQKQALSPTAVTLLAIGEEAELFSDERKETYAAIKGKLAIQILCLRDQEFSEWLQGRFYKATGLGASSQALKQAIETLSAKARFDGECRPLHTRFARIGNEIWIDLADDRRRAVRVTTNGWTVEDHPPILFKYHDHMRPLPEPSDCGDPKKLLDFFNMGSDQHKMLALVWDIVSMIAGLPKPIMLLFGDQGSGKSMASRLLRTAVDPTEDPILELHSDPRQLAITFDQNAMLAFDNQSSFKKKMSDFLCRAVTGSTHRERKLYTDRGVIKFSLKRSIIMNGINPPIGASDLMDRCISIQLERLKSTQRKTEGLIFQEFNDLHPTIFGGMLDVLVETLRVGPSTGESPSRMVDFFQWGMTVANALGYNEDEFTNAMEFNDKFQTSQVIENDPLAIAIQSYMEKHQGFDDTPTKLYGELTNEVGDTITRDLGWPKSAARMSRQLKELKVPLASVGIEATFPSGHSHGRKIVLKKEVK